MKINKNTYLSIEEIISLPTLTDTNISDDGKRVAFVKKTTNWKDNNYRNHIWIYDKEKGQSYPLTTSDIESTYPLWSPDSKAIAYLRPVDDGIDKKNQIFVESINDSSGVQITNEEEGVSNLSGILLARVFIMLHSQKNLRR